LFDMDGTLVDSTAVVERGWAWWATRHQLPLEEILRFSHGRPTAATYEHFLPGIDHTAELAEMLAFEETELHGITAVPGAEKVIAATQQGAWAVVTSATRKLALARIAAAGLPLPEVLVPVDEIKKGKPDPEGFLLAAKRLGVNPKECLVFEDTSPGIQAGLNAGMQVIGLLTTMTAQDLAHQPLTRDFRDVRVTALVAGFEVEFQKI
jgi:sugar-phosphatase